VPTARGNPWKNVTVRQYLRHPRLAGFRVHRKALLIGTDGQPVRGQWDPLLDRETWDRLQALLASQPDPRGRVPKKSSRHYLLSGVIRCGICGSAMYGNVDKVRGYHYYRCVEYRAEGGRFPKHTQTIAGPASDEAVSELVLAYLAEQDDAEQDRAPGPWPGEADLARAEGKVAELMAAFNADQLPGSIVFPQVQQWEATVRELTAERQQWAAQTNTGPVLEGALEEWPRRAEAGDTTWQRALVEKVLDAVLVKPRTLKGTNHFQYDRLAYVWRQA
jgi:hypothetical protein